jgi:hypothetical protein
MSEEVVVKLSGRADGSRSLQHRIIATLQAIVLQHRVAVIAIFC